MEKKDIINHDSKHRYHGYQETYSVSNRLSTRGTANHGLPIKYLEAHLNEQTKYFIR